MCLGIPGQVVQMLEGYGGQLALVDVAGEHRKVNVGMLPEETFAPGDWVIIHMGFVVEKTDEAGADELLHVMRHGRLGEADRLDQVADANGAAVRGEQVHDPDSRRVADRLEELGRRLGLLDGEGRRRERRAAEHGIQGRGHIDTHQYIDVCRYVKGDA